MYVRTYVRMYAWLHACILAILLLLEINQSWEMFGKYESWQAVTSSEVKSLEATHGDGDDQGNLAVVLHGSLNVPIEHHPTIRYMVYNGYYKVMSNIPKMGHLPTPENGRVLWPPPSPSRLQGAKEMVLPLSSWHVILLEKFGKGEGIPTKCYLLDC